MAGILGTTFRLLLDRMLAQSTAAMAGQAHPRWRVMGKGKRRSLGPSQNDGFSSAGL